MPPSVSSTNSSYYDPSAQFTPVEGPEPPATTPSAASASPPTVTIPPVVITGEAGARELVRRLDANKPAPSCAAESAAASVSCLKAGTSAAATLAVAPSGIGAAIGIAATFAESVSCGMDLRALYDCKTQ